MATRFSNPNNLFTAIVWFSGIHLSKGSEDPPETKKGRGAINACNSCRSYPSSISFGYRPFASAPIPVFRHVFFQGRSEEHTSELQSRENLVCRLLLEKQKIK